MTQDTYHVQIELSKRYSDVPSYAYAEFEQAEFDENRNQGDVVFCSRCEDYYSVTDSTVSLCFRCLGHKYEPSEDLKLT